MKATYRSNERELVDTWPYVLVCMADLHCYSIQHLFV